MKNVMEEQELDILKIVNQHISKTLYQTELNEYVVAPFDHSIFLDNGLYDRKSSVYYNINMLGESDKVIIKDKWDNKEYSYYKTSNDYGGDKYETAPKYVQNREQNRKNMFAYYKGTSMDYTRNSFTHLFLSSMKATQSVVYEEYFVETHGDFMGDINQRLKSRIGLYAPTKEILNNLPSLDDNRLIILLCLYSTYFLLINFTEPDPEITNEHRLMEDILTSIHTNQRVLIKDNVREAYLDYLGILSRAFYTTKDGDSWIFREFREKKFHSEVFCNMIKYRDQDLTEIADIKKYISEYGEELTALTGGHPDLLARSSGGLRHNTNYRLIKEMFIDPYRSSSNAYDMCASKVLEHISKDNSIAMIEKVTKLAETAKNVDKSSRNDLDIISLEAHRVITEQVEAYTNKKSRYINRVSADISTGAFKIKPIQTVSIEGILGDMDGKNVESILDKGYLPFGYSTYMVPTTTIYYEDPGGTIDAFAKAGVKHANNVYSPIYSPSLYNFISPSNLIMKGLRNDTVISRIRVSELEFLNSTLTSLLSNTLKYTAYKKNENKAVKFYDVGPRSIIITSIDKEYNSLAHLRNEAISNGGLYLEYYENEMTTLLKLREEILKNSGEMVRVNVDINNMTKVNIKFNTFLLNNLGMLTNIVGKYGDPIDVANLFNVTLGQNIVVYNDNVINSLKQINGYFLDFLTDNLKEYPEVSDVFTDIRTVINNNSSHYSNADNFDLELYDMEKLLTLKSTDSYKTLTDYLGGCILEITRCKAKGYVRRECYCTGSDRNTASYLDIIDMSSLDIEISLPYIEFYNIFNNDNYVDNYQTNVAGSVDDSGNVIPFLR